MRIQKSRIPSDPPAGELELFTARSGTPSARIRRNGALLHLHSAVRPEGEAAYYESIDLWGDLIVFLGAGLGYHVLPLLDRLPKNAAVLVIDRYPHFTEHWKNRLLSGHPGPVTAVSVETPEWQESVRQAARGSVSVQILRHPASCRANPEFYAAVLDTIATVRRGHNAAAPSGGALLLYGSHFLEEELKNALARRGEGSALLPYKSLGDARRIEQELERAIQKKRPRYILSVNMKGIDANGAVSEIAGRHGIPVVVWFVDDPHPILPPFRSSIGSHLVALSWERAYLPWLAKQGFGKTCFLPLAGDPDLFFPGDAPESAEIAFVGSAMSAPFLSTLAAQFLWTPDLGRLAAAAALELLEKNLPVIEAIGRVCERSGTPFPFADEKNGAWFCAYVVHTASMMKRKRLVEACLPLGIETFGDPEGWRALFGPAVPTHPDVDYRTGLGAIYRSIDISVNITSCQMPTAVNQRVFDIPLCNRFVLNDHQPDLGELFDPGEVATYRTAEELADKASWFRRRPEERSRIAKRARNRILACHTYDHRVGEIERLLG